MHDPEQIFRDIQRRYSDEFVVMAKRIFPDHALIADLVMTLRIAPVLESADGFFEPMPPHGRKPGKNAWRWIIAARYGLTAPDPAPIGDVTRMEMFGTGWHPDHPNPDDARHSREPLDGLWVADLVACPLDLSRVSSRLLGLVDVVGWPLDPSMATRPVRIWESPLAWLWNRCEGVALAGDVAGEAHWLRHCDAGLIVGSIALGDAIMQKIRRPMPAYPKIMVAA